LLRLGIHEEAEKGDTYQKKSQILLKHEFKNPEKMVKGAVDFVVWMLRKNIQPLTTDSTLNIVYMQEDKPQKEHISYRTVNKHRP